MKINRLFSLLSICLLVLAACNKKDAPPPTLTADKSAINLTAATGKEYLQITANVEWSLTGLPTGVTATPANGKGDAKVEIVYPANTSVEPVTGTLILKATGVPDVSILYKQMGTAPSILSDKTTITADPDGKTETVVITSNTAWKLNLPAGMNWIAADKTAGAAGSTTITFTIIENQIGKEREASVSFTEALGTTALANIGIKQLQPEVVITSRTEGAKGGGLVVIDGLGFSPVKEENIVTINGQPATITKAEHNHLELTVPAKAGSGDMVVKVNAKTAAPVSFSYQWVWRSTTYAGDGSTAVLNQPALLVVDNDNNLYVAQRGNHSISKIQPNKTITLLAGGNKGFKDDNDGSKAAFEYFEGMTIDKSGNIHVADAPNRALRTINPAGNVSTRITYSSGSTPFSVAVEGTSTILVSIPESRAIDFLYADGSSVRFSPGFIPMGLSVDLRGVRYMFNWDSHKFYKGSPGKSLAWFCGGEGVGGTDGAANIATFGEVRSTAVDAQGVLYVNDNGNKTIRMIEADGTVTTIAGKMGLTGDVNGVGDVVRFKDPTGIAIDKDGNLYVADSGNNKIKKLTKE